MEAFDKVSDVDLDKYTEHTRVVKSGQTVLQAEAALAKAAEDFGATAYAIVGFSGGNGWTGEAVLYRDNREKSYEYATVAEAVAAEKEQREKQAAYDEERAQRHPETQNDPTAIGSPTAGGADGDNGAGDNTNTGSQTTGAGNEVSPSTGATSTGTGGVDNNVNDANTTPGAAGNASGDSTTGQQGTTNSSNQDIAENKSGTASDAPESDEGKE